jgi:hypothetical protein
MEVQVFDTCVPEDGSLGPWIAIEGANRNCPTAVRITAFRPDEPDRMEHLPIWGEIEWHDHTRRGERFSGGMVEVVHFPNAPRPRLRFESGGIPGGRLCVVVQLQELPCGEG